MKRIQLAQSAIQYQFPPRDGKHYGFNLIALLDDVTRSALIIDTAYEEHAAAVHADLDAMGYSLKMAVISHFHPDHILGLQALPKVEIIGSPRWKETLQQFGTQEELAVFAPTRITTEDTKLTFGRFELRFRFAPGHAPCSQYTLIDSAFIHVADNVMTSNTGQDVLPWAEYADIDDHIASLELLHNFGDATMLLSHGCAISNRQTQRAAIANRVHYFRNVLKGEGAFSYEQATQDCTCEFLHQEWFIHKE